MATSFCPFGDGLPDPEAADPGSGERPSRRVSPWQLTAAGDGMGFAALTL